ncbi:hypothetical protein LINGRAHAP2_LOCUS26592 [Linum grandiflorum]
MDAADFFAMYDFCWFEMEIFSSTTWSASLNLQNQNQHQQQPPPPPSPSSSSSSPPLPESSNPRQNEIQSTMIRSTSDYSYSNPTSTFHSGITLDSPDSVLAPPPKQRNSGEKKDSKKIERRKSLTSLEFEELKGVMDLGFALPEEDKDSWRLVSILPGLRRLRRTESSVRRPPPERPYLSEAWAVEEEQRRKKKKEIASPVMNWRVSMRNEAEMKDRLRLWAYSVASTLRH